MKVYCFGRQVQLVRVKSLQSGSIFYFYMLYQVFVSTCLFAKEKNNFLLNFLKDQVFKRDDVYLIEIVG